MQMHYSDMLGETFDDFIEVFAKNYAFLFDGMSVLR